MSPPARLLAAALVVALSATGCAKAKAGPTPVPPPEAPPLAARSLVAGVGGPTGPPSVPVSALVAGSAADAGPPTAPPGSETPVPPPGAAVNPPARLGTPETADVEATTRRVNGVLERARKALATVNPERLSADARVQYQTARQLIEQADEAVRVRNFVYAIRLADKAETLARRLAGGAGA